ncbi:pentapeptide repeat-containing protein [Nostoc sp. FACHB-87]|uniref:pentapeptide repeat-containing protein n=1 Tax=Nostocaceae TaxID=1162 RepID=UPI0016825B38|nr:MULTISPECIES: pentapeptide repeat-containing protein [Nostocaceae]MBD2459078.1 pentapeptide repeat-containing protein [Nostoc sp. FACHB-87]MBD2480106.1 pentapeptide repeat-containing protein [Anabaena sp. FACHB-83]
MANEDYSAILQQGQQGVEIWNKWRRDNPDIVPQPSNNDLSNLNLSGVNLSKCNLTNFFFKDTNLINANLSHAYLIKSDFGFCNLTNANLTNAYLGHCDFTQAELNGTIFDNTDLSYANLSFAKLNKARFKGANFRHTQLKGLDLSDLDFSHAILSDLNLSWAKFIRANLSGVDLSRSQLFWTDFTAATLTGACIQDSNINNTTNLTDVICGYIYRRQGQQERRPSSGNFAPGEFTKLYQTSLETVDLIFRNGIDWDAFAYSFKKVEVENQSAHPIVTTIELKGDGIVLVKVVVDPDADKAKFHSEFMQGYEFASKALEAQYQARLDDKDALIAKQESQINRLFGIVEQQGSVQKALAENPRKISNYYMDSPQFAGGMVDAINVEAQQIGGSIQNNNTEDFPS